MEVDREGINSKGMLEHYEVTVVKDTAPAKKATNAKEEAVAKEAGQVLSKFPLIRVGRALSADADAGLGGIVVSQMIR